MPRSNGTIARLLREEDGAALLEYGILVLLIAVVCIAAVKTFGSKTGNAYTTVNNAIP
jgi:pilus assembly protein Flp/PilA